ncbi:TetR/AcrR family transcriptional regulator [Nocardioides mangrovi]|uniref:TetR/AcrR family transcriptional regulator n=1 Tax=Nocardioides mangrovi TaxID=2874580 RepID=A0ABS7U9F2_9ACTN|nr:TetR/AcrR family transcriptional regulator [Nocardioides mangrovi]MBZ5737361.1 TetR/AcrR family transcriptional regulator [Nocardioides mangrovi]
MVASTRRRLVDSAMALFAEQGFESTSVEDVVARAGVGRTTFFRHFPTKEDVVFPDHDALLEKVDARLATGTAATARTALEEASAIVLDHYLDEGETARQRYRLTRAVTPLRHRELASVHRYELLFSRHLRAWLGDADDAPLRAELTAGAVITAHNHVLRRWLRGEVDDPQAALAAALDLALAPLAPTPDPRRLGAREVDAVLAEVRRSLLGG